MKKVELLSPVGNIDMLKQAIHNGCDAVYLGGKKFGARAFCDNFSKHDLIEAIKYCHLYNVKIYIAANTLVFDNEINEFLDYIKFLYENKVDAVIMQDIGMIDQVKKLFPNLEIHASTQCHNHSSEVVNYLKKLGVSRVVLARELSINEIANIKDIETEVFIHGALCICYSGCCLFSSMNGKRSGNRGECVASCRLPYKLIENDQEIPTDGKYLLSTKELCSLNHLKAILDSGVDSLKIEGRMKSPEYVGYVTKLYRKLIDAYYQNQPLIITSEEITNLKKIFNRDFTKGFINDEDKSDIINIKTPNHIGISLGKIIDINKYKIKILLDEDLNQEDGIRFLNQNKGMIVNKLYNASNKLTNQVKKGNIAILDNKIGLTKKDKVLKTTDILLQKQLQKLKLKKINVEFYIKAKYNQPLTITIKDDLDNKNTVCGHKVQKAINNPTTKQRIIEQVNKLGDTPFIGKNNICDIDDQIFIPIKEINELRRLLTDQLKAIRENPDRDIIIKTKQEEASKDNKATDFNINILVRNETQLQTALENNLSYIYVTDYKLYKKYEQYSNIYYRTNRLDKATINRNKERLLVTELGALNKYASSNDIITDYYLNITNFHSYNLIKQQTQRVTLSVEYNNYNNQYYDAEIILYGRIELMIMKYCPLNYLLNNGNKKCSICKNNNKYYLKDQKDNLYPILNEYDTTHILHYKNINNIDNIKEYIKNGITNFRIELYDEDKAQIIKIIESIKNCLNEYQNKQ